MKTEQEWLTEKIEQFKTVAALNDIINVSPEAKNVTDTIIKTLKVRLEDLKGEKE